MYKIFSIDSGLHSARSYGASFLGIVSVWLFAGLTGAWAAACCSPDGDVKAAIGQGSDAFANGEYRLVCSLPGSDGCRFRVIETIRWTPAEGEGELSAIDDEVHFRTCDVADVNFIPTTIRPAINPPVGVSGKLRSIILLFDLPCDGDGDVGFLESDDVEKDV